jgi:hypothetical protein
MEDHASVCALVENLTFMVKKMPPQLHCIDLIPSKKS